MKLLQYLIRSKAAIVSIVVFLSSQVSSMLQADEYVVLDGFRGRNSKFMKPEVDRLRSMGHRVTYLPWTRWRAAARSVHGSPHVIGYSLGGSRAAFLARRINVRSLQLIDPVRLVGPIRLPNDHTPTTVYRATVPSRITSSVVAGQHRELRAPTDHSGMPSHFHNLKR